MGWCGLQPHDREQMLVHLSLLGGQLMCSILCLSFSFLVKMRNKKTQLLVSGCEGHVTSFMPAVFGLFLGTRS